MKFYSFSDFRNIRSSCHNFSMNESFLFKALHHWAPSLLDRRITIVGRKYSVVTLYKNQKVYFQRDPDNENDKNAIVVRTYERNTVGHLPRSVAALYAPYLQMYTCVFGCITETYYGQFKTSMIIKKIIESKDHEILTLC